MRADDSDQSGLGVEGGFVFLGLLVGGAGLIHLAQQLFAVPAELGTVLYTSLPVAAVIATVRLIGASRSEGGHL